MAIPAFLITVIFAVNSALVACCPSGWETHGNSCYHVSRDTGSWIEAQRMCEEHGSFLAHIETQPEDQFIQGLLRNTHHGQNYWVSGSDWTTEGEWVWEPEGTPALYTHWAHNEPNNLGAREHCLALRWVTGYKWSDNDCHHNYHYVCEQRLSPVVKATPVVRTTEEALITEIPK